MGEQQQLRRRIKALEAQQVRRRRMVAERKADLDMIVEREDRKIANMKAQLTIEATFIEDASFVV